MIANNQNVEFFLYNFSILPAKLIMKHLRYLNTIVLKTIFDYALEFAGCRYKSMIYPINRQNKLISVEDVFLNTFSCYKLSELLKKITKIKGFSS